MLSSVRATMSHWDLPEPAAMYRPDGGTNNTVWIIDDAYVLRIYDNVQVEHVRAEHRLLTTLAERDTLAFAVPEPVPDRSGRTIVHTPDGRSAALFPFIPGQPASRADPRSIELAAAALGSLDQELAAIPLTLAPRDGRGALDRLHPAVDDLGDLARELDQHAPGDARVAWFQTHVDETEQRYSELLDVLPVQLLHGDFAPTNVLIDDNRVTGVLDFDHAYLGLRAEDPVAAMLMATGFGTAGVDRRLAAFRRGYARTGALEPREEAAVPTLLRRRGLGGIVWWSGRWRLGLATFAQVREQLEEGVWIERWLASRAALTGIMPA